MKLFFVIILSLFIGSFAFSQNIRNIAFYNVENLFDTIDGTNDDAEFLPLSKNDWNSVKYFEKLKHVNQVFDQLQNPLLIGLCEIENENVVRDVLNYSTTMKNYGVVHHESPDARGIDVALIYDSSSLKLVSSGKIRFILPEKTTATTRDILWGKFVSAKKDTIIGMVNHWPSRIGGASESEPNRLEAAKNARKFIDSLLNINANYKIVFMGDLNDYPTDKAPLLISEKLNPMICASSGKYGGTSSYKDKWDILDHIFVSKGFTTQKGMKTIKGSGKILSPDFLLTEYKGQIVPFRTYGGSKYLGGYSDHLPVSIDVKMSK